MAQLKEVKSAPTKKRRVLAKTESHSKELWYRPTLSGWTPERVRVAHEIADSGPLQELADLVETMFRDSRISGVLSTRTHGLLGLPLKFTGGTPKACKALQGDDKHSGEWYQMANEAELAKLSAWGNMLGVGLAQRIEIPRTVGQPHRYKIETWSPRWLTYYHQKESGTHWRITTQEGQEPIVPGDGQWIIYQPYGARRPWAEGLWRATFFPWLLKHFSLEDRANLSEALGTPIRQGTAGAGSTEKQRKKFLNDIANLGKRGTIILPQGWDMKLVELMSAGKPGDIFDTQIKDSNEEMTIAIAGQVVTTEGMAGFSDGGPQDKIEDNKIRFDGETLSSCMRAQHLQPWARMNYGSAAAAPWPEWETERPEDETEKADKLSKFGDAVTKVDAALKPHGYKVDAKKIAEEFNIPILPVDPMEPAVPAPEDKSAAVTT